MPSASEEDREWIELEFGSIDCGPILQFLLNNGWIENRGRGGLLLYKGDWKNLPVKEKIAANFLVEEWDFAYDSVENMK